MTLRNFAPVTLHAKNARNWASVIFMAVKTLGERKHQAAIFIYKNDGSETRIWPEVEKVFRKEGKICAELHDSKPQLLNALMEWNVTTDPTNSFLFINSHAGEPGICCTSDGAEQNLISWKELASHLPKGVQYLWLMGCNTQECMNGWHNLSKPVLHRLLATTGEESFGLAFVPLFAAEISLTIMYDDETCKFLQQQQPELAKLTKIFEPAGPKGTSFRQVCPKAAK
jgi:hypothetical protein